MSSNKTDFNSQGYEIQRELSQNISGVTYLAIQTKTQLPVVIKEFKFAQGATWVEYEAHQREIELLRQLHHPSLPVYLDEFETPSGFCLVQEYKQAPTLAQTQYFTPQEVKQIAMGVLDILVYLQGQNSPILHRDIKPENILVDRSSGLLNVHLVDFGLAIREESSPVVTHLPVKGSLGFMPPEQLLKQPLSKATDLYGLGATLICLVTETQSKDIGKLIDENYRFNLRALAGKVTPQFSRWLAKMVEPRAKHRFANAETALKALKPISVVSKPPTAVVGKFMPLVGLAGLSVAASVLTTPLLPKPALVGHGDYPVATRTDCLLNKLFTTGACENCNLSEIQLKGVDLQGANLSLATLQSANLQGANFQGAHFKMANLMDAQLQGINLQGAYSDQADFHRANLDGANLQGANLNGANFSNAHLQGANLNGASLEEANLEEAQLKGAQLQHVNLRYAKMSVAFLDRVNFLGANLDYANLYSAYLQSAYLKDVNLDHANLRHAHLVDANLEGATLKGANLKDANLINANLQDADLTGANLQDADLRGANLKGAKLPKGANLKGAKLPEKKIIHNLFI